jgi:hypothetical protein
MSGRLRVPWAAKSPAVNKSESPGRKNPIRRPDSANTIRKRPMVPNVTRSCWGSRSTAVRVSALEAKH